VRLLLVAPSISYRVEAFLDAARAVGCQVTVASDAVSAIPGAALSVAFDDPGGAAARLAAMVGPVDGVVGTDGDAVVVAAELARLSGLPANPPAAMTAANDKHLQRLAGARSGVPQPEFVLVEGEEFADWSMLPVVVKPLQRSGSQGVIRADTPFQAGAAVRRVRRIVGDGQPGPVAGTAKRISTPPPVLVERFVPGMEVAVEGLLRAGRLEVLAVFDKPDTPEGPTFPETLLVSPARLRAEARARVLAVAERACAALGLVEGPVHVECKVDGSTVWFLELAARTIGGLCSRALLPGGVRLEELVVRHALGLPSPRLSTPEQARGVLMLPVASTGRLDRVRGVAAARAVDGVSEVVVCVGPGQGVVALPEGDRYLGFVFAQAATADRVEAALREAWSALEVDITAS
jgi:biotin carboxylase